MKHLLTILLLLAAATAHGQIDNPVTAGSLGLGWSALTNAQSTLYSGQATRLFGYAPEIAGGSTNLTGFNVLGYTNTNGLVIPANILIGEDQTVGGPRNARNVTVNGAVTIQYPYSSPSTIYANNSIAATDASTYTNTLLTWSSNAATFATNVSIAGSLSVGSFTTTTPSTWALDATQTAAATNGRLTLPSNANVIRLTNNNAISSVTNGVLGAFYYLVNQATNAVTLSNVGGITIDGAQNLTLSPNESATLIATGPTNVSVVNRGDLTDVALGGTANTAPQQTADLASSLMTRELSDARYLPSLGEYMDGTFYRQIMADWMPTRTTNSGAVAFQTTGSRWQLIGAANTGSVAGVRIGRMEQTHGQASGGNGTWNSGFTAFVYLSAWSRENQVLRFVVGHDINDPIGQYPTNRAVGIEFSGDVNLSARLIAHNGTTATNGPLITGLRPDPYAFYDLYAVRYYPNGTVELYRSVSRGAFTNIAAATISGGPTNNGSGYQFGAVDVAYDNGTNAASGGAVTSIHWWGYQYHD